VPAWVPLKFSTKVEIRLKEQIRLKSKAAEYAEEKTTSNTLLNFLASIDIHLVLLYNKDAKICSI
jgi:hypothetical protein